MYFISSLTYDNIVLISYFKPEYFFKNFYTLKSNLGKVDYEL